MKKLITILLFLPLSLIGQKTITITLGAGGSGGSGITNIETGYGLSGGPITSTGTLVVDSAALSAKYLRIVDTATLIHKTGLSVVASTGGAASYNSTTGVFSIPQYILDDTTRYIIRACILRPRLTGSTADTILWDVVRPGGGGGTYGAHTTINMKNATTTSVSGQITLRYGTPGHLGDSVIYAAVGVDDVFNTFNIRVSGSFGTDSAILWPLQQIKVGGYVNCSGTTVIASGAYVMAVTSFDAATGKILISVPAAYEPADLSKYSVTPATNVTGVFIGNPVFSRSEFTSTNLAMYIVDAFGNPIKSFPNNSGFVINGPYVTAGFFTLKSPTWQQTPIINGGAILFLQIVKRA